MPKPITPRNGRFGARGPRGRWLGTFDTLEQAEQAVSRAHERRQRPSRRNRDVVPPSEAQVLALAADGPLWLRGMILVAAYTGLRLFEIAGLRVEDFRPAAWDDAVWTVVVTRGKGGYADELAVCFEPAAGVLLEKRRTMVPGARCFTTPRGTPVSRQTLARAFKERAEAVGFEGTFHSLRHFHACWLIDRGGTDLDVSVQLRHHDNGEEVRRRYGRHRKASAALRRLSGLG